MENNVVRNIGVGDREHVRSGLLQILCLTTKNIDAILIASLHVADQLQKQLRFYANFSKLSDEMFHRLNFSVMGRHRNHDLMAEYDGGFKHFDWLYNRADLIIVESANLDTLAKDILTVWKAKERFSDNFLDGKCKNKTVKELRELFPEYYEREEDFWKIFTSNEN